MTIYLREIKASRNENGIDVHLVLVWTTSMFENVTVALHGWAVILIDDNTYLGFVDSC